MKTKIFFILLAICHVFNSIALTQNIEQIKDKYLIVLDIQQHFTKNVIQETEAEMLIKTINSIINDANPQKVIYVKSILTTLNISLKGFDVDTLPKLDFDNRLNIVNDQIVVKNKANAFKFEKLTNLLEKDNDKEVIVVGLMAEHCVYKTLLGGKKSGYEMFVIPEALAQKSTESKDKIVNKMKKQNIEIINYCN